MAHDDPHGTTRSGFELSTDLEPLASQVISMLRERQTVTTAGARQVAVDYLLRATSARTGFDPCLVLDEMRGFRLTVDAIIDLYIPQVAFALGELWLSSDMSFADVTIASLRLQALLSEASLGLNGAHADDPGTIHALVVVPEGEQHFLGASVVAAQLRRLGGDVSLSISETRKQVMARVICDQPNMVLFSCARIAALESITRTVKTIRASVDTPPVLALGGSVRASAEGMKGQTDVDLVTKSAADVYGFCTKRMKALGQL
ncbi:hypothetical protein [uncultured Tateyamaria sp.]|uniref:hypothetical protein n=1 Tax=uncultured Tateyamaria sp. TaxID=455651 RepID=UPI002618DEEC|nr:hypothetical protein [uncultured Tateyamaria sp.]